MVRHLGGKSDAVTGTLGVQWEPSSDTMAYARYSRGYKAFGLSAGGGLAAPYANPEFVDSVEVGLKARSRPAFRIFTKHSGIKCFQRINIFNRKISS